MTALWVVLAALAGMVFALVLVIVAGAALRGYVAYEDRLEDDAAQAQFEAMKDAMARKQAGQ